MNARHAPCTRGFVLVNALVLVAAMAAAALFLLSRSETGRAQLEAGQAAAQLALYLDAFESLALTLIDADTAAPGAADHAGEAWARAGYDVTLDRGRVAGNLRDLQGLFNLNWLANTEDAEARAAFDRMLSRQGLPPQVAARVVAFMSPGGPANRAAYRTAPVPSDPVGGSVLMPEQLYRLPGLQPKHLVRLETLATALPGDSRLNVNTAAAEVLMAFLPGAGPAALDRLIQERRRKPFLSLDGFLSRATEALGADVMADIDIDRFDVGSEWFEARIEAQLGSRVAARRTVLQRQTLPQGARVAYRLSKWP